MRIWKKSFLKEICKEVRIQKGHPRWRSGRKPACQCRRCKRCGFHPWVATRSSILAWKIPWTKESRGLQYMGWQRVRHDWATKHICTQSPERLGNKSQPGTEVGRYQQNNCGERLVMSTHLSWVVLTLFFFANIEMEAISLKQRNGKSQLCSTCKGPGFLEINYRNKWSTFLQSKW